MVIDLINGGFAVAAGLMATINVRCLYRDRCVSGSSLWPPVFFNAWGVWSAYFYFDLAQWASFSGSLLATNDKMRELRAPVPQRAYADRLPQLPPAS
jgi:hypothetical protein